MMWRMRALVAGPWDFSGGVGRIAIVRSKPRTLAFLVAGIAVLGSAALLVDRASAGSASRVLSAHGLSIALPAGWHGRVVKPAPNAAAQLIAADFGLPRRENFAGPKTTKAMRASSIYIWIANEGSANGKNLQPGRWKSATLPLAIRRADIQPFEGVDSPSEAVRWLFVKRKALLVLVGFGRRHPSNAQLTRANRVLSTFRMLPTR